MLKAVSIHLTCVTSVTTSQKKDWKPLMPTLYLFGGGETDEERQF